MSANALPVPAFPGFKHYGVVSDAVKEIVTTFTGESRDALASVPPSAVAWADVGTRVTPGVFEVKIPIRLPSGQGFQAFDGSRSYHKLDLFAPVIRPGSFDLNYEWPIQIDQSGIAQLKEFYGAEGLAQNIVDAARAFKAQLVASLTYLGFTNPTLGLTAQVLTIPQPGAPNGLPLFSDGTNSPLHYSHPLNQNSRRFANLFLGAGKITDTDVFGNMLVKMSQVPHPTLPNMTLGNAVTDIVGPTHMLIPFYKTAVQNLSLEVSGGGSEFAATSNIYQQARVEEAMRSGKFIGASGIAPWRFWIAPQFDSHPYVVANPGKHMWMALSAGDPTRRWGELAALSREFVPMVTLFGDGDPESMRLRMVRMIADLDAGAAAGLPHFAQMYFETTPGA